MLRFQQGYAPGGSRKMLLQTRTPQRTSAIYAQWIAEARSCLQAGQGEKVEQICLRILAQDVHHAEALFLLGLSGRLRGRLEMAASMMRRAIQSNSRVPLYHTNLGVTLQKLNRVEEAEACYRRALDMQPEQPEALCGLGSLLCLRKENDQAIALFRRAVKIVPEYGAAWNNLGITLKQAGKLEEAIPCLEKAQIFQPDDPMLLINLGEALHEAGRFEEAVQTVKLALKFDPESVKASQLLAYACYHAGHPEEAIHYSEIALSRNPGHATTLLNLAMMHMLLGDYTSGLAKYEIRHQVVLPRDFHAPEWKGEDLHGRRILLWSEQGMGDMIQFLRYVDQVVATGAEVLLELPERLLTLATGISGIVQLLKLGDPLPECDFQISLFSLPLRFETTVETIPARVPYLAIPEEARQKAAALEWPGDGLRVGLNWTGSPTHRMNGLRSISLRQLEVLFDLPGVHFFSLQMGPGAEELEPYAEKLHDLAPVTSEMADTAAQMEHLDLVITIDTSIAHLAGAIGLPVWILLNEVPDWRWMLHRADSPWYPTARLIRQHRQGDWSVVIETLRVELLAYAAHSSR